MQAERGTVSLNLRQLRTTGLKLPQSTINRFIVDVDEMPFEGTHGAVA